MIMTLMEYRDDGLLLGAFSYPALYGEIISTRVPAAHYFVELIELRGLELKFSVGFVLVPTFKNTPSSEMAMFAIDDFNAAAEWEGMVGMR